MVYPLAPVGPQQVLPTAIAHSAAALPSRAERVKHWLASPRARGLIVLVGVLLVAPSLSNVPITDDHFQALHWMAHSPIPEIPHSHFDLFTFGRPGEFNERLMDRGILLPWWTDREYLVSFFRPLSALTHDLDGWIWPRSPAMAHVQTIGWYLALLAVLTRLYQRLVEPAWVAGLALVLYVVDDTHGDTLSWIANRHAVITATFGLLALLAHDRWRRGGRSVWRAWPGPVFFAVGLLAGEGAILTAVFVASYAVFIDPAQRRSRALSILPYAAVLGLWRFFYQRQGYGAFASDGYLDASREPAAFFARLPAAMAVFLQGQFSFLPTDAWTWAPDRVSTWVLVCAVILAGMLAAVVVPTVRRDRRAAFWCVSLLLSLIPMSSAIPTDRVLIFSSVAAMALLAQVFATFAPRLARPGGSPRRAGTDVKHVAIVIILGGLFARRVVLAPFLLPLRATGLAWARGLNARSEQQVSDIPDLEKRTVIIANPPLLDLASCLALVRATRGEPVPRRVRWLNAGTNGLTLTRTSDRSLVVRPSRGFFADRGDRIFRSARRPMKLGEEVVLKDVSVTITELLPDGKPAAAEFVFAQPLESPNYVWRQWTQHGCDPLRLPVVGESVTLPEIAINNLMWSD
jgi:hypothetical protein